MEFLSESPLTLDELFVALMKTGKVGGSPKARGGVMNWSVLRLVGDHTRRLFGLWLLVAALQIMQTSALWVLELDRMPLIGAMMCAMAYFATSASPLAVMRTLPIRRRGLALYRWWMLIGVPSLLLYACVGIAWINHFRWPHAPSELQAGAVFLAMVGSLGVLSVLPLPALAGNLSNLSRFAAVWSCWPGFALYGFPVELVTTPVALALGVGGVAIAIASLVMACRGEILGVPVPQARAKAVRCRSGFASARHEKKPPQGLAPALRPDGAHRVGTRGDLHRLRDGRAVLPARSRDRLAAHLCRRRRFSRRIARAALAECRRSTSMPAGA